MAQYICQPNPKFFSPIRSRYVPRIGDVSVSGGVSDTDNSTSMSYRCYVAPNRRQLTRVLVGFGMGLKGLLTKVNNSNTWHTPKSERNEIIYAEDACLLTIRTILHLLRRQPAGFEELVRATWQVHRPGVRVLPAQGLSCWHAPRGRRYR